MSDEWIVLVPDDPRFVPSDTAQFAARCRLAEMMPEADAVDITMTDAVEFYDCGANFERILCPSCRGEVDVGWWQGAMNQDNVQGFQLALYALPCCGEDRALHHLVYEWPQAFGRFSLQAMNPSIGKLDEGKKRELEELLGTRLIVVYQHV